MVAYNSSGAHLVRRREAVTTLRYTGVMTDRDKADLAQLLVASGAVRFGRFTTKSGRRSPYFVNLGQVSDGTQLAELGRLYTLAAEQLLPGSTYDCVFGPAYKAIPIAIATAMASSRRQPRPIHYCFDRKDQKAHGEGGLLVGHVPDADERVLIVDDVITDGASKRSAVALLGRETGATVVGLLVAVDRLEPSTPAADAAKPSVSALAELDKSFGFPARAMLDIRELVALANVTPEVRQAVAQHLSTYGVG